MSGSSDYTRTPNLALYKPISSRAVGTWGDLWNSNADALDSAIHFASGGGPFLPLAGGTVFGPLNWTSTGSTTPRSAQDRSADVANVLDFGADPTGVADSSAAINAAAAVVASGDSPGFKAVYLPTGTYRVNHQINLTACQAFYGDSRGSSVLMVDQAFSPTHTAGIFITAAFFDTGPVLRDFGITFAQPLDQGSRRQLQDPGQWRDVRAERHWRHVSPGHRVW